MATKYIPSAEHAGKVCALGVGVPRCAWFVRSYIPARTLKYNLPKKISHALMTRGRDSDASLIVHIDRTIKQNVAPALHTLILIAAHTAAAATPAILSGLCQFMQFTCI